MTPSGLPGGAAGPRAFALAAHFGRRCSAPSSASCITSISNCRSPSGSGAACSWRCGHGSPSRSGACRGGRSSRYLPGRAGSRAPSEYRGDLQFSGSQLHPNRRRPVPRIHRSTTWCGPEGQAQRPRPRIKTLRRKRSAQFPGGYQLCTRSSGRALATAAALLANGNVNCLRSGVNLASQLHSRELKALPSALNDFRRPLSPQICNGHAGVGE